MAASQIHAGASGCGGQPREAAERGPHDDPGTAALFKHASTLAFDQTGNIFFCSVPARALLGRSCEQILNHPIATLIPALAITASGPSDIAAFVAREFGRERWRACDARDANGSAVALEINIAPAFIGDKPAFVAALRRRTPGAR